MSDPAWVNSGKSSTALGTATIEADDELFTITDHGLGVGDTVVVDTLTGGASGVLDEGQVYWVVDVSTNTFALSQHRNGAPVEFSSDGGADVYRFAPQFSAIELRRLDSGLLVNDSGDRFGAREGIHPASDPAISVSGTTWTVENVVGVVYPALTSTSGPYRFAHPTESGSLDPADGSNPRIDALDLQIQDDDTDASGFRRARVVYVDGTPGADPDPPTVTTNALRLGTILVPAGGSPSPSIATLAQFTVASGGTLPVTGASQLPTSGRYAGMAAYRQDLQAPVWWDDDESEWRTGWPETVEGEEPGLLFNFTHTSYAPTGEDGPVGASFVAAITGRARIEWSAGIDVAQETNASAYISPVVRTGGTVGSGSVVRAADDFRSVRISRSATGTDTGGARPRMGASVLVSGLTPGDTYNVRLEHRVTSQTGTLFQRYVMVSPAT